MIDWNKVIEQALTQSPAIIGAVGIAYWRLRKKQDEAIQNQHRIESKVNGNHKVAMKAIRAQGQREGLLEGKKDARHDRAEAAGIVEKAAKVTAKAVRRSAHRRTDK